MGETEVEDEAPPAKKTRVRTVAATLFCCECEGIPFVAANAKMMDRHLSSIHSRPDLTQRVIDGYRCGRPYLKASAAKAVSFTLLLHLTYMWGKIIFRLCKHVCPSCII